MNAEERVRTWLRQHLAKHLGIPPDAISFDRTLGDYGLDSVDAILIAGELEESFEVAIDPAAFLQLENFETVILAIGRMIAADARETGT